MSDRQSRNVEGQIEADDRSAQVVGPSKQDFVDEFGNGPQDKSTLAAERSKQRKIVSADESWVVEETSLIKFVCLAKLICADAQTLRRVDSRLGVEDKRLELSESEFLRRVDHRSRSRYDEPFPESLLADLHKDDLIPELERSGNEGLSPKYFATWRHYRRALQLQRLRSVGIKGRDALRVQLFVRGYGLKVFEVRDAVRRELLRGLSELRPPLRSQYFHSQRDPGPAHLAAVERQLGSIDPRLESAGFKQPTQFMLKQIRLGFGVLSRSLLAPLEGLLLAGLNDHPLPKLIEEALNASDDDYMSARVALAWMERTAFRPLVGRNVIDSPNWSTHLLVIILVLQHVKKSADGFTVANILTKIPFRDGFDRLARSLMSKMADSNEEGRGIVKRNGGSEKVEHERDH